MQSVLILFQETKQRLALFSFQDTQRFEAGKKPGSGIFVDVEPYSFVNRCHIDFCL